MIAFPFDKIGFIYSNNFMGYLSYLYHNISYSFCNLFIFSHGIFLIIFCKLRTANFQRNSIKMQQENVQSMKSQANHIRRSWRKINKQLQYYLDYQLWMIGKKNSFISCCTSYSRLQDQTSKQFKRGYKTLTKTEKASFYLMNVKIVDELKNPQRYTSGKQKARIDGQSKTIRLQIQDDKWFKKFTEVEAQLLNSQKKIKIQGVNHIDLHKFIIRKSGNKKLSTCLVLESIQSFSSSTTIRLCIKGSDSQKAEAQIRQLWKEAQINKIRQMMDELSNSNKILRQIRTTDTANSVEVKQFQPLRFQKHITPIEDKKKEKIIKLQSKNQNQQERSLNTQMFQNQYLSQIDNQIQFFTVIGSLNTNDQQVLDEDAQNQILQLKQKNNQVTSQLTFQKKNNTATEIDQQNAYLKHKYQQRAITKGKPVLFRRRPTGHIIFGDQWTVRKNGDLAFTNQQKIKMHSSVFKMIIKKLGSDLLAGKGFNISLPAMIFGSNTYLEKMLEGYTFAPIFLQKAAKLTDPVQRIRNIVCFMLGVTVTFVQADKPFNPVLGETYQGFIDGCPGYAQQISHHPPISSVLFYGRGYRVHGHFEPIVQIGLNKCIGINKGIHTIQFNDGTKVKCQNAHAIMHSLAFGERKLEYIKKSDIIDKSNRLVCQIYWGKQNDSHPQAKLHDFVKAKIMKIKNDFDFDNIKSIKKKDIEQQYQQMNGRWTGQIYSKGNLFFDIQKQQPHQLQHYSPCLPSDSRFRKDLNQVKNKNFQQAQICKDQIQQTQRYYRKLRKKFHPHS